MKEDVVLFVHVCFYVQVFACTVFMCVWGGGGYPGRLCAVADAGIPRGGGANTPGWGAPTYDFVKFPPQMHEIEIIRAPLRSTNGVV